MKYLSVCSGIEAASVAADGPPYKVLGNSMAVPVMHWLGKQIQMVSAVKALEVAA